MISIFLVLGAFRTRRHKSINGRSRRPFSLTARLTGPSRGAMARPNTGTGRPGSGAACAALLLLASARRPRLPGRAVRRRAALRRSCGASRPLPPAGAAATAAGLVIAEPWARATPGGAKVGGGYLRITNAGREPDRLVGGSVEVAGRFEIHEMSVADGVMRMRPVDGVELEPGASVDLKPGGLHAMFLDLKAPLREGQTVRGTLVFERAGTVPIAYRVRGIGARPPERRTTHIERPSRDPARMAGAAGRRRRAAAGAAPARPRRSGARVNDLGQALLVALGLIAGRDPELLGIIALSLRVSLSATLVAVLLGAPAGAALAVSRFPGRQAIVVLVNALLGLPPVVVGLAVYLLISRSGPLGAWGLLFTPAAMVIAQAVLATPIVVA